MCVDIETLWRLSQQQKLNWTDANEWISINDPKISDFQCSSLALVGRHETILLFRRILENSIEFCWIPNSRRFQPWSRTKTEIPFDKVARTKICVGWNLCRSRFHFKCNSRPRPCKNIKNSSFLVAKLSNEFIRTEFLSAWSEMNNSVSSWCRLIMFVIKFNNFLSNFVCWNTAAMAKLWWNDRLVILNFKKPKENLVSKI